MAALSFFFVGSTRWIRDARTDNKLEKKHKHKIDIFPWLYRKRKHTSNLYKPDAGAMSAELYT